MRQVKCWIKSCGHEWKIEDHDRWLWEIKCPLCGAGNAPGSAIVRFARDHDGKDGAAKALEDVRPKIDPIRGGGR
jgi:hypothetical protein